MVRSPLARRAERGTFCGETTRAHGGKKKLAGTRDALHGVTGTATTCQRDARNGAAVIGRGCEPSNAEKKNVCQVSAGLMEASEAAHSGKCDAGMTC